MEDTGLPPIDPRQDRAMICGSPAMLDDTSALLDELGLNISQQYVTERSNAHTVTYCCIGISRGGRNVVFVDQIDHVLERLNALFGRKRELVRALVLILGTILSEPR